ncbi:MAG: tetratricopeptide repeat protein [Gemmataceae bacterium]
MSSQPSAWVFDVSEADFEQKVIQQSHEKPVVIDFWAPWCQPCRMLGPMLEKITHDLGGAVLLAKINTDACPVLAQSFGIEAIPAVKGVRDGQLVSEFTGVLPEEPLREFFQRLLPTPADQSAAQARTLEETDPAQAEALYHQILEANPQHDVALLGLARVLLRRGQEEQAEELLERTSFSDNIKAEIDRLQNIIHLRRRARDFPDEATLRQKIANDPGNAEWPYQLGCVLAVQGKYADALSILLEAAQRDRQLAVAKVREAMVHIFHIVGVRSELADDYRGRLAQVLY